MEGRAVTLDTSKESSHRKNGDGRGIGVKQLKKPELSGKCRDKDMGWQGQ
jgi:hypothetical protein